jgi:GT2 family glycosyltransferase
MSASGTSKAAEKLAAGIEPPADRETGWALELGRSVPLSDVGPAALSCGVTVAVCTLRRPESVRRILQSLDVQTRRPDEIVVVDASSDALTELAVREEAAGLKVARIVYVRVGSSGVGLTRQRNRALALARRDLIAFFDDDVVLEAGCLAELERVHREIEGTAGVGAMLREEPRDRPPAIWRVRRILGIVPNLAPGRYHRSGMSTPWSLAGAERGVVPGDWLPGFAMMWKTDLAREIGFYEAFAGYAQAEDLEFSLRAGRRGRLLMASDARVRDDHALAGRPDAFRMGYMAVHNRWIVHRRCLAGRTRRDAAWFAYAWIVDTLLLGRHLVFPSRWRATVRQIGGRLKATLDLAQGR